MEKWQYLEASEQPKSDNDIVKHYLNSDTEQDYAKRGFLAKTAKMNLVQDQW